MRLVGQLVGSIQDVSRDRHALQSRTGLLHRPVWLLTGGIALLLLLAFGLLLYSSWRHDRELEPIERHLDYIATVDSIDNLLRALEREGVASANGLSDVEYVQGLLTRLQASGAALAADSPARVQNVRNALAVLEDGAPGDIAALLRDGRLLMRKVLAAELAAQDALILEKRATARREQQIALGLLAGLLMVLVPLGIRIRQNIIRPLDTLGRLMTLMSRQDYTSAPTSNVDPMLLPLFENYNRMVNRLVTLEQAHQNREDSLTTSVRRATRMLLKQQQRVAQAERLGAVGEIAASVAHELRNPLTSIDMALQNLRGDLNDPEHVERVDLVLIELKRINRQLNGLLEGARQSPEPSSDVDVSAVLRELRTLVRYQITERIAIRIDAPDTLDCRLPEAQFRQCILNLILNAAQVMGDGPGMIRVAAESTPQGVRLVVEDDGPGLPDEMLENGVRAFGSWRRGGTGLGLVMVRRFASDLGGGLRLENRPTGGARITLDLPCERAGHATNTAGH